MRVVYNTAVVIGITVMVGAQKMHGFWPILSTAFVGSILLLIGLDGRERAQ